MRHAYGREPLLMDRSMSSMRHTALWLRRADNLQGEREEPWDAHEEKGAGVRTARSYNLKPAEGCLLTVFLPYRQCRQWYWMRSSKILDERAIQCL